MIQGMNSFDSVGRSRICTFRLRTVIPVRARRGVASGGVSDEELLIFPGGIYLAVFSHLAMEVLMRVFERVR